MKTQINHLVTGGIDTVGTAHALRSDLAQIIKAENPETMTISLRGLTFRLGIRESVSGKSWVWSCAVSREQWHQMHPDAPPTSLAKDAAPYIAIMMDATVYLYNGNRKGTYEKIQPAEVTIL